MQFSELKNGQKFRIIYSLQPDELEPKQKEVMDFLVNVHKFERASEEDMKEDEERIWKKLGDGWSYKGNKVNAVSVEGNHRTELFNEASVELIQ